MRIYLSGIAIGLLAAFSLAQGQETSTAAPTDATGVRTIQSLAGPWRCREDRGNVGVQEAWYKTRLDKTATLPGAGSSAVVWYQRDLEVPGDWKGSGSS